MVLCTYAEAFVRIIYAKVNRDHLKIVICGQITVIPVSILQRGILPVSVLIEHGFFHAEFLLCVVGTACQCLGICAGIRYIHIPYFLEVIQVGSLDLRFSGCRILQAVILELVIQRHICQMSGESPGGGIIQSCGCESACQVVAELVVDVILACLNIVCHGLQLVKAVNVIDRGNNRVVHGAVVIQDGLVYDDAVCLVAVRDSGNLSVVIYIQGMIGYMVVKIGILQIVGVVIPGLGICGRANIEDGRSLALCHLGLQRGGILSVCSGKDIDLYAGLIGVGLCQILPCLVCFRFEVQQVNLSVSGRCLCCAVRCHICCRGSAPYCL